MHLSHEQTDNRSGTGGSILIFLLHPRMTDTDMSPPSSPDSITSFDVTEATWYDESKTYCVIAVERSETPLLEIYENDRFVALIPQELHLEQDKTEAQIGLALPLSIDTFADVTEGHTFGRISEQCDVMLDTEAYEIENLHFRVQLDYTQKIPELDIINCSPEGIMVSGKNITTIGERVRVYQGDVIHILAGTASLKLLFPYLDFTNPKLQSRWEELRTVTWSLLQPALRNSLVPGDARQRYIDAELDCIWQEARPFRSETGSMTVTLSRGKQKQKTGFPVVLKKLHDRHGDARESRLNLGESAAMTRVRHANIVTAFREAWPQGTMVLVEHTPHTNIADFVTSHNARRLKEDAVMDLALQSLNALSYLLSQGLAHRDLKPAKILVFRTDPPLFKLTDFGGEDLADVRAYMADRIADATVDYIAPEVFELGAASSPAKTDVWSLGIVVWELLTGTTPVPFVEDMTYMSCFRAILNWQPRLKELLDCGVSDEGQELVLRMVEKSYKFRPDVDALRADESFDYLEFVRKNEPCE